MFKVDFLLNKQIEKPSDLEKHIEGYITFILRNWRKGFWFWKGWNKETVSSFSCLSTKSEHSTPRRFLRTLKHKHKQVHWRRSKCAVLLSWWWVEHPSLPSLPPASPNTWSLDWIDGTLGSGHQVTDRALGHELCSSWFWEWKTELLMLKRECENHFPLCFSFFSPFSPACPSSNHVEVVLGVVVVDSNENLQEPKFLRRDNFLSHCSSERMESTPTNCISFSLSVFASLGPGCIPSWRSA